MNSRREGEHGPRLSTEYRTKFLKPLHFWEGYGFANPKVDNHP